MEESIESTIEDKKETYMSDVIFELKQLTPMSEQERKRIQALKDPDVDYSDIPAMPEEFWEGAERGRFYRPIQKRASTYRKK